MGAHDRRQQAPDDRADDSGASHDRPPNADQRFARNLLDLVRQARPRQPGEKGLHDGTAARLCFHLHQRSYNTTPLIEVLNQLGSFYAGQ